MGGVGLGWGVGEVGCVGVCGSGWGGGFQEEDWGFWWWW